MLPDKEVYTIEDFAGITNHLLNDIYYAWGMYDSSVKLTKRAVATMLDIASVPGEDKRNSAEDDFTICFHALSLCEGDEEISNVSRAVVTAIDCDVPIKFALMLNIVGLDHKDVDRLVHMVSEYSPTMKQSILRQCQKVTATVVDIVANKDAMGGLRSFTQYLYYNNPVFSLDLLDGSGVVGDMLKILVEHVADDDPEDFREVIEGLHTIPQSQVILLALTLTFVNHDSFMDDIENYGYRKATDVINRNRARFAVEWMQWVRNNMEHADADANTVTKPEWLQDITHHVRNAVNDKVEQPASEMTHTMTSWYVEYITAFFSAVPEKYCTQFMAHTRHIAYTIVNDTWSEYGNNGISPMNGITSDMYGKYPAIFMDMLCSRCNGDVDVFITMMKILMAANISTVYDYRKVSTLCEIFDDAVKLPTQWAADLLS